MPFMDASVIEPQTDAPPKQHPMQYAEKGKLEEETLQRKQAHSKGKKAHATEAAEAKETVRTRAKAETVRGKNAQGDGETARSDELTEDDAYNC